MHVMRRVTRSCFVAIMVLSGWPASALCAPTIGGMTVYRERNHNTASFMRTLISALEPPLAGAMAKARKAPQIALEAIGAVKAMLACGPAGKSKGFSRAVGLRMHGSTLSLRRGDSQATGAFEEWAGEVVDGVVTIEGRYRDKSGGPVRPVSLHGTMAGTAGMADGKRGPRDCSLEWSTQGLYAAGR